MRCKKHLPDLSSTVGVCASCLRERLQAVLDAQIQIQSSSFIDYVVSDDHRRQKKPDPNPPPPPPQHTFPRSVSPYVNRRREHQFHSTTQLDPAFSAACDGGAVSTNRKLGRFWILSNIFRSRSNKTDNSSRESYEQSSTTTTTTATPPSSTWYSTILTPQQQNQIPNDRRVCRISDRGASPVDNTPDNFFDGHDRLDSGSTIEPSPQRTNHTTAAVTAATRRSRLGPAGKSLTSMALCLSPLVRASPNRQWNSSHKGLAQELGVGGTHHISTTTTTTFCSNRSRKLADFGRHGHNR